MLSLHIQVSLYKYTNYIDKKLTSGFRSSAKMRYTILEGENGHFPKCTTKGTKNQLFWRKSS